MRGIFNGRAMILGLALVLVGAFTFGAQTVSGDDGSCLKAPGANIGTGGLADMGVNQLERLPWNADVVQFNLNRDRPVAIAACYLMDRDLIVLDASGRFYVVSRRNLQPRWVGSLRHRLAKPPSESGGSYAFLTKDLGGAYWIESFNARSGTPGDRFPRRLPFAAASGIAAEGGMVFVPSLGRPGNNKTIESVNLVSGRLGWGYKGTSLIVGGAQSGSGNVIFAGSDGVVTALEAGSTAPSNEAWTAKLAGYMDAGLAVTPKHVVAGTHDALLYCLDSSSGDVNWMIGLDHPLRQRAPWVLGRTETVSRPSQIEGAAPIQVQEFTGIAFARTQGGLHAFDLGSGKSLFTQKSGGRPVLVNGKWVLTVDRNQQLYLRDKNDGYKVKGEMSLRMFDLIPTNRTDGALFAVTSDGGVVGVLPK